MNQIIKAMKTNTNCKILSMSNIEMPDSVAKVNDLYLFFFGGGVN